MMKKEYLFTDGELVRLNIENLSATFLKEFLEYIPLGVCIIHINTLTDGIFRYPYYSDTEKGRLWFAEHEIVAIDKER